MVQGSGPVKLFVKKPSLDVSVALIVHVIRKIGWVLGCMCVQSHNLLFASLNNQDSLCSHQESGNLLRTSQKSLHEVNIDTKGVRVCAAV